MSEPTPPQVPVSATVVSYNGGRDLERCLRSLLEQRPAPSEVIVVDNGSTDGSREMVEREFPNVEWVSLEANLGPCAARNEGLRRARHRLVFQVDQDVELEPRCLARLLEEWEREEGLAVLFPRALDASDPSLVHYDGGWFHYAGVLSLRHFYVPRERCSEEATDVDAFISLAALVDRDALLEVGGYDATLFILFEDHDISYRLRLAGRRIRSLPAARVLHRSGTEGISFRGGPRYPARRLYLHSRNRWLVVLKNYRLRTLLVALPGVLVLGVAYVAFAASQGALGDYLRAKGSLLRHLPHIRRERRRVASFRAAKDRDLLAAPPLTFSPRIERGPVARRIERLLNVSLRVYWSLVRALAG